jgi:uncharacterized protein (TIGR04551 family)
MRTRFRSLLFASLALAGIMTPAADVRADEEAEDEKDATPTETKKKKKKHNPSPYVDARTDDWFTLSGPLVNIDGYVRVRSELFHKFSLGRVDAYDANQLPPLWPQAPDNSYVDTNGVNHSLQLCGPPDAPEVCNNDVQAGANMRLRLSPSIHISDNLHVWSQIDMLDNIVLGSHPQGYANTPSDAGGYNVVARGGYSPLGTFAATQWAPTSGVNSVSDAVVVKRVWGSYVSPLGKLSFGRMPNHWGLGMVNNAGDDYDSDWQSTVDRLMFTYAVEDWNLYFTGSWEFANEGPSSIIYTGAPCLDPTAAANRCISTPSNQVEVDGGATPIYDEGNTGGLYTQGGQPYDLARSDDVDQWTFTVVHKIEPQLARYEIAKGRPVVNAGLYLAYRTQDIANETDDATSGASIGSDPLELDNGFVRRGYEAVISDVWLQLLYGKLRFEAEAAWTYGTLDNTATVDDNFDNLADPANDGWTISQFGITTETEWLALEDRLRLNFGFGFASGDADVRNLGPTNAKGLDPQLTLDRKYTTFGFHPDYRVDLILFRNLLSRVQGAYYFRPGIDNDFMRDPDGQRVGGGAAVIWSRASEPVQAPGNHPDLGLELNLKMFYQISDGRLSHDVMEMGGFYTAVEYGVLFPLPGLDYLPGEVSSYSAQNPSADALDVDPAQIARWYLGIMF